VVFRYFEALDTNGCLELVGEITEYLDIPDAAIVTMKPTELHVGDALIARGTRACFITKVLELQDYGNVIPEVTAVDGQEIGARFSPKTWRNLKLFRVKQQWPSHNALKRISITWRQ